MTNRSGGASRGGRARQGAKEWSGPAYVDERLERDQAETGLRASERIFRTTFDRAVVGIAHASPEGRWLRVNQQFCDLLGYTRDELAARTFQDVTHPDDLAASLACFRRLLAGEQDAEELDKRYLRKDGEQVWVHVTLSLVRTPEGTPDYFITMLQDITERKRLEQERARLLEWERAARREAEATNAQLGALQALTDTALSHLAIDDLLRELLGRVTAVLGIDTVGIFVLDADGRTLTLQAVCGLGEEDVGRVHLPVGQGFPGRVAARQAPLIADDLPVADFKGVHSVLRELVRSVAGVPLLVEGRLVGVLAVGSATPRRFTAADVQLLQRAADRVALAIDRARLYAAEQEARQEAEAALARAQASEAQAADRAERLRTILETMTDAVAVYDAEGLPVQMVNRAYRELYALDHAPADYEALPTCDRARLVQVRDAETDALLPFEDTPAGRALHGEVVTGPSADIRARAFDGRELELNSSAAPLRDGDGHVAGAVLVLRDVTWRKQLEREREEAREQAERQADQLDRIFEAVADGLIVYDAEGQVVRANAAVGHILGVDAAPPGFDQLPLLQRLARYAARDEQDHPIPPEEWPFMRMLRGEVGTGSRAEARDIRMRALDGREIELTYSTAPLRDREGHLVGVVNVLHDLTERKRLEREREAAREQAERQADQLDRIFEAAADGLLVWDAEGRIVRANVAARRILGVDATPPDLDHLPMPERMARYAIRDEQDRPIPPEEWPFMRILRGEVGTGSRSQARGIRMRALDGREIELTYSTAPLRDREGHPVAAVSVLHDQTERNRLERERAAARADELAAREASRRMEAFLAVAAHDLRSPLTAVVGYLALAARRSERLAAAAQGERPDDLMRRVAAVRDSVEDAIQGAQRLTRLLTLLFDTAAIRADRLELHRALYDLVALVREQVAGQRAAAPDRVIRLHTPEGGGPVPVEADADRIRQVVANYLTNAIKYSPPDRPVDVWVEARRGQARVAVRDAGPGIPKAERARVWELFHRAPGLTPQGGPHGGSLGLGLYVSKAIAEAHGGRVGVRSVVGEGSTFWFTLPLAGPRTGTAGGAF